ncbi:MAG: YfiR family protein [Flavobacteriales bacterium]|nr:YfiR family protein [Flavobacteriales bacterium]
MKRILAILLSVMILSSGFKMIGVDTNSKMKAIFILNFTKLIEWPEKYREGNFVVGVVGESPLYNELVKMSSTKKVANQSLMVKQFNSPDDITKCHILYLSKDESDALNAVITKVKSNSTLIITEKQGLVDKGAGINFIVKDNRQKFELNKGNVEKYKLKVSSNLEALAETVK